MTSLKRKAFTLVELVIVIAVISILAAVLIPTFSGIIRSANKSADEQILVSINLGLAMADKIENEADLKKAINETFSEGTYEKLAPKSAQYGYYYWYDVETNTVVLKTYSEIVALHNERASASSSNANKRGAVAMAATVAKNEGFKDSEKNNFRMFFENFFILDKGGSVIGEVLNALDQNDNSKIKELQKIDDSNSNYSMAQAILDRLSTVSKVTHFDIYRTDTNTKVSGENVIIPYTIGNIILNATGFTGENDVIPKDTSVTWSSDDETLATVDENGKVTINYPEEGNDGIVTITATPNAGGNSEVVKLYIVKPINFDFTLGSEEYDMTDDEEEKDVEIVFDGSTHSFEFTDFYPYINFEDLNVDVDWNVVFDEVAVEEGKESLFTIDKNDGIYVLTLKELDSYEGLTQDFTVTVGTELTKTFTVTIKDVSAEPFKIKDDFEKSFLYRLGNENAVKLNTFFVSDKPEEKFTLTITDVTSVGPIGSGDNFTATVKINGVETALKNGAVEITKAQWQNEKNIEIHFSGTGVAKLQIGDIYKTFEIVEGFNAASYTDFAKLNGVSNVVMLSNIDISSGGRCYVNGKTLYGNDFTFDVSNGNYSAESVSVNCVISLTNGTLDNVRVLGKPFTGFSATAGNSDNICNVYSCGNDRILNCYISNCAAPVRLNGGNLEIVNTTLKGGSIANLDIRSGTVILDNVTTINQHGLNELFEIEYHAKNELLTNQEEAIGFGVLLWYENVPTTSKITIKNSLSQYNNMSKEDFKKIPITINDIPMADTIAKEVFNTSNGTGIFIFDADGTQWINTGIFSMSNSFGSDNIKQTDSFVEKDIYDGSAVSYSSYNGYVFSVKKEHSSLDHPEIKYESKGQGEIKPIFDIDLKENEELQISGSNSYCYEIEDNEKIVISFDKGNYKIFTISGICNSTKGGKSLGLIKITLDNEVLWELGKNSEDEVVEHEFSSAGEHVLTFEFADRYNYDIEGTENVIHRSKSVTISVTEVAPTAKNATFTFGSTNTSTENILIDNKWYVSAVGVSATDKQWGYITVNGNKIFYPIIEAKIEGLTELQAFYYVFNGTVTITDYKDGGQGEAVVYNASTTIMPSNLTVVNGIETGYSNISSACVDISSLNKDGPSGEVWDYSASTTDSSTTIKNGFLAHQSPSGLPISGSRKNNNITIAQFCYTDNAGVTYYYFVGYYMPAQKTTCVTPDTLVTLADGTQKEIQYVTYEDKLLVWNFHKGEYDVIGSSIVMNHGYDYYKIVTLNFADGTTVNTINGHGFFDVETNKYVILNEENVAGYVGNEFVKVDGDGYSTTKLVGYSISEEYTESWSILTATHYNCILEGMWTLTPAEVEGSPDYLMPFEIKDMKYDEEAMKADIEKYGLYTYEEFADLITIEQFEALGLATFKVSVGKGYITYEDILFLIDLHC